MQLKRLPNAELEIMKALWSVKEPLPRSMLDEMLADMNWEPTTILHMIARLEKKGFVAKERVTQGRGYLYRPAVSEQEYLKVESQSALGRMFDGSAKNFLVALHSNNQLSAEDIQELSEYLDSLKKE